MTSRELVVLGSAAQAPTRTRNHNGYLLRWDGYGILFDPGEGTQRQMLLAGVPASWVDRICLTHAHGDHCLGLPGVVQRMALDQLRRTVPLHYPESARPHVTALLEVSAHVAPTEVEQCPVAAPGAVAEAADWTLCTRPLDHRIPAVGYRLREHDGVRMLPHRLARYGVAGPDVGRLARVGTLDVDGRTVRLADVSEPRRGQTFAFVMDTRWCTTALELAADADLLVCESTFLDRDRDLAHRYAHMTAREAGVLAREAGARRLVLTHFSQRYGASAEPFVQEASTVFDDVVAAEDLTRIPVPPRR